MSMKIVDANVNVDNNIIRMCDMKDGQIAKTVDTHDIVMCIKDIGNETILFLVLENNTKTNFYLPISTLNVEILSVYKCITIEFRNNN